MTSKRFIALMALVLTSPCAMTGELPGSDARAEIIVLDNAWIKAEVFSNVAEA